VTNIYIVNNGIYPYEHDGITYPTFDVVDDRVHSHRILLTIVFNKPRNSYDSLQKWQCDSCYEQEYVVCVQIPNTRGLSIVSRTIPPWRETNNNNNNNNNLCLEDVKQDKVMHFFFVVVDLAKKKIHVKKTYRSRVFKNA
jgi:hypothetical protein